MLKYLYLGPGADVYEKLGELSLGLLGLEEGAREELLVSQLQTVQAWGRDRDQCLEEEGNKEEEKGKSEEKARKRKEMKRQEQNKEGQEQYQE